MNIYILIIFSLNDLKCWLGMLRFQSLTSCVNFPSCEESRTYNSTLVFIFF